MNNGLKDTLDPGEIVYEYFNYTVSDGTATDTGSIVIKLQNGGAKVKCKDWKCSIAGSSRRVTPLPKKVFVSSGLNPVPWMIYL